ncbi:MAG: hypothetical protein NTV86_19785, partial [Planctomycetota bacterium]|nr:hypothetical protein [Planctomycetota bacterium]
VDGGCTIMIGAGVYAETNGYGYLQFDRSYLSTVVFEPWHAGDVVTVTGTSGTGMDVFMSGAAKNYRFEQIHFTNWDQSSLRTFYIYPGSKSTENIEFVDCTFTTVATGYLNRWTFAVDGGGFSGLSFTRCTFTNPTSYQTGAAVAILGTQGAVCQNVTLTDCTAISGSAGAIIGNYVTNIAVSGGTYSGGRSTGLSLGQDNAYLQLATGSIVGVTARSTMGHALLVPFGCVDVVVDRCHIIGGDDGLVDKGLRTTVKNSLLEPGSVSALYYKGARDCQAINLTIIGIGGIRGLVGNDQQGTAKNSGIVFRNIAFVAYSGEVFSWSAGYDAAPPDIDYCVFDGLVDAGVPESGLGAHSTTGSAQLAGAYLFPARRGPCDSGNGDPAWRSADELDYYGRPRPFTGQEYIGAIAPVLDGDANLDGEVGPEDFGILKDNFGRESLPCDSHESWILGDFDGDGEVGPEDFGLLKDNFGLSIPLSAPLTADSAAPAVGTTYSPIASGLFGDASEDDKIDILDTLASLTPVLELTVM